MKLPFKHNEYQSDAVEAVVDCFAGQLKMERVGAHFSF
jgi:restriction endonuclease